MSKLRLAVRWWAELMEKELRKNDYKGKKGWLEGYGHTNYSYYLRRAKSNLREIHIGGFDQDTGDELIIKCCVDCANFCMMLADNVRNLIEEEKES